MSETIQLINDWDFVLASKSPRRHALLKGLGLDFEIRTKDVNEDFPSELEANEIPEYLCAKKAHAFRSELKDRELLITADTVVWINDHVLNKPEGRAEAKEMLKEISGATHEVFTAVCLTSTEVQHVFSEGTKVHFNALTDAEIEYYLDRHAPFDKAGAYGIQEFIGYIGIHRVEGDFYNVVGFPVQRFWKELKEVFEAR